MLLKVLWWPQWEGNLKRSGYMYTYDWFTCYTAENNTTLWSNYDPIKNLIKKCLLDFFKVSWTFYGFYIVLKYNFYSVRQSVLWLPYSVPFPFSMSIPSAGGSILSFQHLPKLPPYQRLNASFSRKWSPRYFELCWFLHYLTLYSNYNKCL